MNKRFYFILGMVTGAILLWLFIKPRLEELAELNDDIDEYVEWSEEQSKDEDNDDRKRIIRLGA